MSIAMPSPASHTLSLPARAPAYTETVSSGQASVGTAGCVNSAEILRGQKAVEINHNGSTYRLQATRLGKLILTK
ncbi:MULTISPECIES: hemin uptake protein HemP [unclassified Polaromonas]|jgi:hemin uptake protein HemP|uniref:hemin uptake protein HemP n=1 Tax=unclassified Polaromonas TaxID=2638319 RepID=UPI000F07E87F|nr:MULTISPECIES: hemin uptake protein HemP [unclassified Polaromonas]AYQ29183.1 hemin uptake protein HemP [Polaromonas sp. SP1]QGJ19702.1 hemin uptake protein HemP [Polaromonas sp. Pch-P]